MRKILRVVLLVVAIALLAGIIFLTARVLRNDSQLVTQQAAGTQTTQGTQTVSGAADTGSETSSAVQTADLTVSADSMVSAAELVVESGVQSAVEAVMSASEAAESVIEAVDSVVEETISAAEVQSEDSNERYATTTVNVRSQAGTESEILGQLYSGQAVTMTGEDGEWTQIDYNGQTAFVKSEFLSTEKTTLRTDWDLASLSTESVNFGYSNANRDERNIPTDWEYYENRWGEFAVKWIGDTSKNTIYLTMDEGFGNDNTIEILQTLRDKGVKITFFVTKYFVDDRPELVQEMLDDGHQLGNHSCTHPDMTSLSLEDQTSQIMTLENQVQEQFGYEMKYFRFPQGIFSAETLGLVNNLGMETVFWSYAYGDYDEDNQPDVAESLEKALNALHPGAIYLLHASSDTNTAMLADFIDGARERGYEFGELTFLG